MLTYEKLLKDYLVYSGDDTMKVLACKTSQFIEDVREENPELVDTFLIKIDLILNPHFTKETAEYAVSKMKNKDGSTGKHWDYETTSKVLKSKGYDHNEADWYYILNMMYSDYYKSGRSDETYIEMACDFMDDVDAPEDKAKRYYKAMHY